MRHSFTGVTIAEIRPIAPSVRPATRRGASGSWAQSSAETESGYPAAAETNTKSNDGDDWVEDGAEDIIVNSPQESRLEDANPIAAAAPAAEQEPVVNEENDLLLR